MWGGGGGGGRSEDKSSRTLGPGINEPLQILKPATARSMI